MSSFWRVTAAIAFAIAIASSRPSSAIASAPLAKSRICAASRCGQRERRAAAPGSRRPPSRRARRGRARRRAPPSRSPRAAARAAAASPSRALSQRSASTSAIAPTPIAAVSAVDAAALASACAQKRTRKWSWTSPIAFRPSRFFIWSSTSSVPAPAREADDHRVRDVAGEVAEPQQRDAELDRADQEREQHGGLRPSAPARRPPRSRESSAIEIALVGPLISWRDESNSAPTAVITIAV